MYEEKIRTWLNDSGRMGFSFCKNWFRNRVKGGKKEVHKP